MVTRLVDCLSSTTVGIDEVSAGGPLAPTGRGPPALLVRRPIARRGWLPSRFPNRSHLREAGEHGRRSAALLSSVEDHDVLDEYQSHGCAVLDKCAGISRHVPAHGADGPAMRHGDHCLPGVCPCDALDCGDDTICELLARLAVVADLARLPAREAIREPCLDLARVSPDQEPTSISRSSGSSTTSRPSRSATTSAPCTRAPEVARVDGDDAVSREPLGQLLAWRRPRPLSGGSACPCKRPSRFHSVSP